MSSILAGYSYSGKIRKPAGWRITGPRKKSIPIGDKERALEYKDIVQDGGPTHNIDGFLGDRKA